MAAHATELRDPHSYITYDDVIALALANTKSKKYFADSQKWQRALFAIREKYKDSIPELKSMFFDRSRTDIPPQSEELYQLINILSASKLISLPNPSFEYIVMESKQKQRVKSLERHVMNRYREYIADIAKMLEGELSANI